MNPDQQNRATNKIPMEECIARRVYKIESRNLTVGVYDGKQGFIGIREKFGHRNLFTEFHWDQGPPFGTVSGQMDTGVDLPNDVALAESLGTVDRITSRPVHFDGPVSEGARGWIFSETDEASEEIHPVGVKNEALFQFLEKIQNESR